MPWEAGAAEAGFSDSEPGLPIPESHRRRAVDLQDRDPASVLNTTRALRTGAASACPCGTGRIEFLRGKGDVLAFERSLNDRILCLFNLGGETATYSAKRPPLDAGFCSEGVSFKGRTVTLPPWGYAFAHLE